MANTEQATGKWKYGVNRWIILAIIVVSVIAAGQIPPVRPYIQLPAEALTETLFTFPGTGEDFYLTNTMLATILADIVLLVLAFFVVGPALRSGKQVFKGITGVIEALVEMLHNLTESTAGKWTKAIFPIFGAITFLVLVANWMELIPGVDSIGIITHHSVEHAHHLDHDAVCTEDTLFHIGSTPVVAVGGDTACAAMVVPFVRAAATDLNFTIALAIIAFMAIQIIGVRAQGLGYFEKFLNFRALFAKPGMGIIDFVVGIFEIVSEFSKIISFSFRLFGNIFAGMVLLFVIGTLIPVAAQTGVLMLEFAVGLIQALVFGMLTMIFMAQATQSHHGDEEHH
ncbi:MAG: F0F1 ATP synthase subunit A [Anaerolineales bacterium]|nr:MAG: F0F1 ATP synthase subunit A [Anaerolineales bacterium]